MQFSCEIVKNALFVQIGGEIDLDNADALRKKLDEALDATCMRKLICDLEGVRFIDSTGLGVLLGRYRKLAALGGGVKLVNVSEPIYRILALSGVTEIMQVEKKSKALGAF